MNALHDDLTVAVMELMLPSVLGDCLDMHSIGALATTLGQRVKDVYVIRCRTCGVAWINRLGKHRRMRDLMLRCNAYRCVNCTRLLLESLTLRLVRTHFLITSHYLPADLEDDGEAHVAPLEVDGLVLGVHQPEVERLER